MREFTKSVFSYSLAISLFSLKQAQNLLAPLERDESKHPATKAYNAVTKPITDQLDESLRSAFHTLDNIQRGLVSLSFSFFAPSFAGDSEASREIRHAGVSSEPELAIVALPVAERPRVAPDWTSDLSQATYYDADRAR